MILRKISLASLILACAACSAGPQLKSRITPEALRADYPALLPTASLRAQANTGPITPREPEITPRIDARAASLKARAASLRGDVIDAQSKERLGQDIEIKEEEV